MKILIIDTFYGPYIEKLYAPSQQEFLAKKPWIEQHKAHFAGGFGTSDAYSHGLGLLGVTAIEIVANSVPLQQAWAREHQPDLLVQQEGAQQLFAILEAQIHWWQADVLYVQDINWVPGAFLKHVKPLVEMVVGQNACPLSPNLDLSPYDLLVTSLPHYVGKFRSMGVKAAYFPIGFDERLLQRHRTDGSRPHALTFVGGLGGYHSKGTQMLEAIAEELPLQVWGYGGQQLPPDSTLKQRWQGEAWADDMYGLLATSQVTINRHIDIAESYANNMRLYEATGMGACLLTDSKLNLPCLFEPDHDVVTYSSPAEAVSKLKQLLEQPEAAATIAARGQARTLKYHTYRKRMTELLVILKKHSKKFKKGQSQIAKPQSLLVVCSAKNINLISERVSDALRSEHQNHRMILISDVEPKTPSVKGMQRWCGFSRSFSTLQIQSCLDSIQPNQVLCIEDESETNDKVDWIVHLRQEANSRNIVLSTVGKKL